MVSILAIDGSYREDGITDQMVQVAVDAARAAGARTATVILRDCPIEFCRNCRHCMQQPGIAPGVCVHDDAMSNLVAQIEAADAYILASPTNFGSVTALFKRFMERLAVYGYWPWGQLAPSFRKRKLPQKKALLLSSSAAPGVMGRWLYSTQSQLKTTARTIGARPVGTIFAGPVASQHPPSMLPNRVVRKTQREALTLLRVR